MKKMLFMLIMLMVVVTANAQMVVGEGYNEVYISYDGGMTSVAVPRSQLPYGNMIAKGYDLREQIVYYGKKQAEEEYGRTGNYMAYQQRMAQLGGVIYTGGVYTNGVYVTPVTDDNMLSTMGSGVYVAGQIGDVTVAGDPLMAAARVINFGKSVFKKKNTTTAPATTTRTAPATRTTTTPATRTAPATTTTRTTTPTTTTKTYNVSTGKFEDLVSDF